MVAEPDTTDTLTLKSILRDVDLSLDDRRNMEPGLISPPIMTDQMRENLEEQGINPDDIIYEGLSDKGSWLVGEEAWDKFMKDRDIEFESIYTLDSIELVFPEGEEYLIRSLPTPAETQFTVINLSNPPASGSITVHYEGEQVTTQYSSNNDPTGVAMTIRNNINNHPNIQLVAGGPVGPTVVLTEKRAGCDYNGNVVYVTSTQGTHICVNGYEFYMSGGTDDGEGCDPLDPPDTPVLKSPSNGSRGHPVNNLTLEWHQAQGAASYRLQVADNPSFSPIAGDWSGLYSTSAVLNNMPKNTTIYWRVRASNSGGDSDWSNTWSFKTKVPISAISYIDTPPGDFGYVHMYSISWALEPIDYIDVNATSFRDWILIGQAFDGGENRMNAVAGIMEYKWYGEPPSNWSQHGDHWFIQGGYLYIRNSDDQKNF